MTKKIYYISPVNKHTDSLGLWKKIETQIKFFENLGYTLEFIDISNSNNIVRKIVSRLPFGGVFNWKKLNEIRGKVVDGDIIYVRYHYGDLKFLKILKSIMKLNKIKVYLEIPTYPYDFELKQSLLNVPFFLKDLTIRNKIKEICYRVITYSDDDEIYGVKTVKLSNVANENEVLAKKNEKTNMEVINLISVATYSFWHGYDRLIEGIKNYYSVESSMIPFKVVYHIVGTGPEIERYKKKVEEYNLNDYVVFYGRLNGKALDYVYNLADIAIDSLGRHRSKVYYNSSLKGKEYGLKGLPIVSGVTTELDSFESYEFYLRVSADESPIDIDDIVLFYCNIYNKYKSEDIVNMIRKFNLKHFSKSRILGLIVDSFEQ